MKLQKKDQTRAELISELETAQKRIAELEQIAAQGQSIGQSEVSASRAGGQVLDLFVEYAPTSIAMFNREMKYIAASRRYLADYQLKDQDIVGRSHYEIFPEIPQRWKDIHQRCLNGAVEKADEDPFPREDGTLDWVRWEIRPWYETKGEIGGIILFSEVITARKQAEQALRQSQENFARAFNSNPAALAITRVDDGTFLILNEAYTNIMGYEPVEVLGHTVADLNIYVNSDERNQLLHQLHEQGRVRNYELLVRSKSGKTRSLLVSMESILYDETQCILSTFIDITERKQMEEELRRSNAELEQFAYVASHDLQEPLRAVAGMVQLLGQRYKGRLDESADEYIGHAVEASTRMQSLINDLLDYSRVDRLERPFERTNMEQVLNTALANLQATVQESQMQITRDPLPTLVADTGQLIQVLQNLIGNAIKFRAERPLHIHIGAEKIDDAWRFAVSDNGIGIEPQYFGRIFLIFQRLHTRRQYPGTGIGLSVCKKIIERHGGQVWVESRPGHGTTFYFTIPEKNHDIR